MTSSSPRPLLALLALAASVLTAWAADAPPKLRLAEVQKVSPLSYQAELTLDPEKEDFTGTIVIKLDVEETTQTIWLNQETITVQKAALTQGGKTLPAKVLAGGDDFVGFHFDQAVAAGPAELSIRYSGKVTQQEALRGCSDGRILTTGTSSLSSKRRTPALPFPASTSHPIRRRGS